MSNSKKPTGTRPRAASTADILARRKERKKNRGDSTLVTDWIQADAETLRLLVATVAIHGTVTFGYTRDGGAYYINYWMDGQSFKEYIRPTEDLDAVLRVEIESWQ